MSGHPEIPKIVSVIVPVFNVEPYLRECLDSVLRQSLGFQRIELIAVDDGSTDGSGRILDEYASMRGITVIHESRSGGAGRPRNVGLDIATGTYVFFLDADDYLGTEALERLVEVAERNRLRHRGRQDGSGRRPPASDDRFPEGVRSSRPGAGLSIGQRPETLSTLLDRTAWRSVPGGGLPLRGWCLHGSRLSRGTDGLRRQPIRLLLHPAAARDSVRPRIPTMISPKTSPVSRRIRWPWSHGTASPAPVATC